jgi:flagellar hook-associated protein 3 FlgL
MQINTVSNIGTSFMNGINIKNMNTQLNELMREVSTGEAAGVYADLGTKAGSDLSLHAQDNALTAYTSAINTVKLKTDQMDNSLTDINNSLQTVTSDMDKLSQGGTPDAGTLSEIQTAAQNALSTIMADLNTNVNGDYVFAGNDSGSAPVADTTAAGTNIANIVSAYSSGTPASTIISNLNSLTAAQLGYNSNLASAGDNTFQAADGVTLNYTMKADEGQFQQIITGLSEVANLQYDPNNDSSFWSIYKDAQSRMTTASTTVNTRQGQLGIVRNQMASSITSNGTLQSNVEGNISTLETADLSKASAQLQTLQTQIQATYEMISGANSLSLVNYLTTA